MNENLSCWCGNTRFIPFSEDYLCCPVCLTLVWIGKDKVSTDTASSTDFDYYGRDYWFNHQTNDLGLQDIQTRSRLDLPERCLYWLRTILKYRLPPAKVLELGSGHGALVALLQKVGYAATGLEIDDWIVNFSFQTFHINVLKGPLETQAIQPASLDLIVLMDVLEHLNDPQSTLEICMRLIKPDGILVMQTPMLPESKTYHELLNEQHPFLKMLIPKEHIHLFSKKGIIELYSRLHLQVLVFEQAYFEKQDMFLIASRSSINPNPPDEIEKILLNSADGRFVLALLDLDEQLSKLKGSLDTCEADRAARLELINHLDDVIQKQNRILKWLPQNILRRVMRRFGSRNHLPDKQA